jgi:glycosyltransferase involved in cell wall biosynthesis
MRCSDSPLITVAIVVRNREWIIEKMLNSLLSQMYPHDKIHVLLVDGNSSDKTVEIARTVLEKADFKGYEIIVKECSIPEGRNICIDNMKGNALLWWDSDVIMDSTTIADMVKAMTENKADIVGVNCAEIFINSIEEIEAKIENLKATQVQDNRLAAQVVLATGMGHTLVAADVFKHLRFDPDLTVCEDLQFSFEAAKMGFKLIALGHIFTFDVNMWKREDSDTSISMPLKYAVKGLRKKAEIQALTATNAIVFLWERKRYLFYFGYLIAFLLTVSGLFLNTYLILAFPVYFLTFVIWQINKRGVRGGLQSALRSILVGVPFVLWLFFYLIKPAPKNHGEKKQKDDLNFEPCEVDV